MSDKLQVVFETLEGGLWSWSIPELSISSYKGFYTEATARVAFKQTLKELKEKMGGRDMSEYFKYEVQYLANPFGYEPGITGFTKVREFWRLDKARQFIEERVAATGNLKKDYRILKIVETVIEAEGKT